jgi:uncharacterized membrane protein YsdA (DUF1294 family)
MITSSVWTAALFFGATGAIIAMPEQRRDRVSERERPAP